MFQQLWNGETQKRKGNPGAGVRGWEGLTKERRGCKCLTHPANEQEPALAPASPALSSFIYDFLLLLARRNSHSANTHPLIAGHKFSSVQGNGDF